MSAQAKSEILYGPSQRSWDEQVPPQAEVQPPSEDPLGVYPKVPPVPGDFPQIDYRMFEIPPTGLSEAEHAFALAAFRDFAETQHKYFTGYQTNQNQKYASRLSWLLDMHTNSVGDPFSSGWFTLNTKFLERACLDYFAALWNIEWPHVELDENKLEEMTAEEREKRVEEARERYWGWVLSMGSTEANLYSLFNARDYLKGKKLKVVTDPSGQKVYAMETPEEDKKPPPSIIFYSADTHYSVTKCVDILELTRFHEEAKANYAKAVKAKDKEFWTCPLDGEDWPEQVPSHDDGSIDVVALSKLVKPFIEEGYPIIVVLNVGSTWKGACDDVEEVHGMLDGYPGIWKRELDERRNFWVHVDGALGASYLPFLEMAQQEHGWRPDLTVPKFDFRIPSVMSICASTHKWPGAPWAGSVYMTRTAFQLFPPSNPSYIGAADTTLGGSRNAATAAFLWDYLARTSYEDSMQAAMKAVATAKYFEEKLLELQEDLRKRFEDEHKRDKIDLWVKRSPMSLAVRFRLVNRSLVYKYTIDREVIDVEVDGKMERRTVCHVYFMQSVTRKLADELIQEIDDTCKTSWRQAFPELDRFEMRLNPSTPPPEPELPAGAKLLPAGAGFGFAGASIDAPAVREEEAVTVG